MIKEKEGTIGMNLFWLLLHSRSKSREKRKRETSQPEEPPVISVLILTALHYVSFVFLADLQSFKEKNRLSWTTTTMRKKCIGLQRAKCISQLGSLKENIHYHSFIISSK